MIAARIFHPLIQKESDFFYNGQQSISLALYFMSC